MQHLTESDVARIAEYVRIGMNEEEIAKMTIDLNNIIDGLAPITQYDLDGIEPTFHPIGDIVNIMRDDEVKCGFSQEVALENAPRQQDGSFLIPSILGEGGDR